MRLPSGTRRASGLIFKVVSTARIPLPRLAPKTKANATLTEIMPVDTSVAVNSTTARLE